MSHAGACVAEAVLCNALGVCLSEVMARAEAYHGEGREP